MKLYHKIQSIYYRDPATKYKTFINGKFSADAFELLQDLQWDFTEKIDGTNIRIGWDDVAQEVSLGGRSDNAQLPGALRIYMEEHFSVERMLRNLDGPVTLIGEGYGGKIQKGSGYRVDQAFILFDVFVEPTEDHPLGIYLPRDVVKSTAFALDIPHAPVIHTGPLLDGITLVQNGLQSIVSESLMMAEGVVARPSVELFDYLGRRVITKIKVKDFPTETEK
jgi:hypothetical protein